MDLGLPKISAAPASSAEQPPGVRRAVGATSRDQEQLLRLVAKQTLALEMQNRVVRSIVLEVFLIDKSAPVVAAVGEQTKALAAAVKDLRGAERAKHGKPHIHAWNGIVAYLKDQLQAKGDTANLERAEVYCGHIKSSGGVEVLQEELRYCRFNKCWDQGKSKLEIAVTPATPTAEFWKAVVRPFLVSSCKADPRPGMAPPSFMANQIQSSMDRLWPEESGRA